MNNSLLQEFIEKYNKDKEELRAKFDRISSKLESIDHKFDSFDKEMEKFDAKLQEIEEVQDFMYFQLGDFTSKLDNVKVYLNSIEDKLNTYKTLDMRGEKIINGELYVLRVKLEKVKPIVNWENDTLLKNKYKEIEQKFIEIESSL